jgi:beta-lactamase regulating signal transducer with metallopeptidase domain
MTEGLSGALFTLLVDAAIKGAVVLLGVIVLLRVIQHFSASVKYYLSRLTLIGLISIPPLLVIFASLSAPQIPAPVSSNVEENISQMIPRETTLIDDNKAVQYPVAWTRDLTSSVIGSALALWLVGLGVVIVQWLHKHQKIQQFVHHASVVVEETWREELDTLARCIGLSQHVRLLVSDRVVIPMAWGVVHPAIVLPMTACDWSAEQFRHVLLHELVHLKRRDVVFNLMQMVCCALYWYNPLVWHFSSRVSMYREQSCDDRVLEHGVRPGVYARHLVDVAQLAIGGVGNNLAVIRFTGRSELGTRIRRILDKSAAREAPSLVQRCGWALLALVLLVGVMGLPVVTRASPHQSTPSILAALVQTPSDLFADQPGSCTGVSGGSGTGTYLWPISPRSIQARYGGGHGGIDFMVPSGTAIRATDAGVVIFAGWSTWGYGNTIILSHGDMLSLYGHLSSLDVVCGQVVEQGQVIGRVGSTGNSSGPHLHFELRPDGYPADPEQYMSF